MIISFSIFLHVGKETFNFSYSSFMYVAFLNTYEKLAEEQSKLDKFTTQFKNRPWILGMGAGSVCRRCC